MFYSYLKECKQPFKGRTQSVKNIYFDYWRSCANR